MGSRLWDLDTNTFRCRFPFSLQVSGALTLTIYCTCITRSEAELRFPLLHSVLYQQMEILACVLGHFGCCLFIPHPTLPRHVYMQPLPRLQSSCSHPSHQHLLAGLSQGLRPQSPALAHLSSAQETKWLSKVSSISGSRFHLESKSKALSWSQRPAASRLSF